MNALEVASSASSFVVRWCLRSAKRWPWLHNTTSRDLCPNRVRQDCLGRLGEETPRVILATGSYIGEGFDNARLDTLFLAMPVSWKETLQQYVGRLHRTHNNKREVRVYDYVDAQVPMLARMFKKRIVGCDAIGYSLVSAGDRAVRLPEDEAPEKSA